MAAIKAPTCTSCGRDLKPHCKHCAWWRCSNRVCGVDLHDFTRGVRTLTNGARERIART
jgi:hypothetical protein